MTVSAKTIQEKIEMPIVRKLIRNLKAVGWEVCYFNETDGEHIVCTTEEEAMKAVFAVDIGTLCFQRDERVLGVLLVCGNGEDIISDYSVGSGAPEFAEAIDSIFDNGGSW